MVCFGPRSSRYNQDRRSRGAATDARRRHARAGAVARRAGAVPRAVANRAAAQAAAGREVGMDWRRGTRGARLDCPPALRCAGLVRATVVGSSDRSSRPSGHRASVDCPFQRSVDRQSVSARAAHGSGVIWSRMEARRHSTRATRDRVRELADRRSGDGEIPAAVAIEGARRASRIRSRRVIDGTAGVDRDRR